MREGVGVNGERAEVLEHLAHHTLARGDVASQADDVFAGPTIAHGVVCFLACECGVF